MSLRSAFSYFTHFFSKLGWMDGLEGEIIFWQKKKNKRSHCFFKVVGWIGGMKPDGRRIADDEKEVPQKVER